MATTAGTELEISGAKDLLSTVGEVSTRVLVPLWLIAGALAKLISLSPATLPSVLVKALGGLGVDLAFFLRFSIAVELAIVVVIWCIPRLARPLALSILGVFMVVLVGELALGASSCGCFGSVRVHPAVTLAVDGFFLVAVGWWARRAPSLRWSPMLPTWRVVVAGSLIVAVVAVAFGRSRPVEPAPAAPGPSAAVPLPEQGYYLPDYGSWIGRPWDSLELSRWLIGGPQDLGAGEQIILLYRKDCEHCHELMELYFAGALPVPVIAVAVPERDGFPTVNVQPMPCDECRQAELPSGVDWFFQTPVVVHLVDGVVECAAEEDPAAPRCVTW